jgi:Fe-S-cluster containining protein
MLIEMEVESNSFMFEAKFACPSGCGQCCRNPEIEATPLEMLPLALFYIEAGQEQEILKDLSTSNRDYCFFYRHDKNDTSKGRCDIYKYRPTLCRLFGVAKVGERFSVCKILKENNGSSFLELTENKLPITSMNDWSMRLNGLDPNLGQKMLPINQALQVVLEKIVLLSSFKI